MTQYKTGDWVEKAWKPIELVGRGVAYVGNEVTPPLAGYCTYVDPARNFWNIGTDHGWYDSISAVPPTWAAAAGLRNVYSRIGNAWNTRRGYAGVKPNLVGGLYTAGLMARGYQRDGLKGALWGAGEGALVDFAFPMLGNAYGTVRDFGTKAVGATKGFFGWKNNAKKTLSERILNDWKGNLQSSVRNPWSPMSTGRITDWSKAPQGFNVETELQQISREQAERKFRSQTRRLDAEGHRLRAGGIDMTTHNQRVQDLNALKAKYQQQRMNLLSYRAGFKELAKEAPPSTPVRVARWTSKLPGWAWKGMRKALFKR